MPSDPVDDQKGKKRFIESKDDLLRLVNHISTAKEDSVKVKIETVKSRLKSQSKTQSLKSKRGPKKLEEKKRALVKQAQEKRQRKKNQATAQGKPEPAQEDIPVSHKRKRVAFA